MIPLPINTPAESSSDYQKLCDILYQVLVDIINIESVEEQRILHIFSRAITAENFERFIHLSDLLLILLSPDIEQADVWENAQSPLQKSILSRFRGIDPRTGELLSHQMFFRQDYIQAKIHWAFGVLSKEKVLYMPIDFSLDLLRLNKGRINSDVVEALLYLKTFGEEELFKLCTTPGCLKSLSELNQKNIRTIRKFIVKMAGKNSKKSKYLSDHENLRWIIEHQNLEFFTILIEAISTHPKSEEWLSKEENILKVIALEHKNVKGHDISMIEREIEFDRALSNTLCHFYQEIYPMTQQRLPLPKPLDTFTFMIICTPEEFEARKKEAKKIFQHEKKTAIIDILNTLVNEKTELSLCRAEILSVISKMDPETIDSIKKIIEILKKNEILTRKSVEKIFNNLELRTLNHTKIRVFYNLTAFFKASDKKRYWIQNEDNFFKLFNSDPTLIEKLYFTYISYVCAPSTEKINKKYPSCNRDSDSRAVIADKMNALFLETFAETRLEQNPSTPIPEEIPFFPPHYPDISSKDTVYISVGETKRFGEGETETFREYVKLFSTRPNNLPPDATPTRSAPSLSQRPRP